MLFIIICLVCLLMTLGVGIVVAHSQGDHTPLHFVTTCDNGVFNGGVFMHLSIFSPPYL